VLRSAFSTKVSLQKQKKQGEAPSKMNRSSFTKKLPNLAVRKLQALIEHLDDLGAAADRVKAILQTALTP
jgi:hypothetical protein